MPAYHSKADGAAFDSVCGCSVLPLNTKIRGPAPLAAEGTTDIVEEALFFFRANVLFRNFDVNGNEDRTLIYLTFYIQTCLKVLEKTEDKSTATRLLSNLAVEAFPIPGESGWLLGTLFPKAQSREEEDSFRAYFRQCREELGGRLLVRVFDGDGVKSKWWQSFSKRKFMGKDAERPRVS